MTPGARLQAAIELLSLIDAAGAPPADAVLRQWYKARRYAGSGDRAAISGAVYDVVRRRAQLDWWLARSDTAPVPRTRVLAQSLLIAGWDAEAVAAAFDGGQYRPAPLDETDQSLVAALAGQSLDHPDQPPAVQGNVPDWLYDRLAEAYGEATDDELRALLAEAPMDLRVNTLMTDVAAAAAALAEAGVETVPGRFLPTTLRVGRRFPLDQTRPYRDGWVEVQDEGSQLIAALADARPGMTVADFCAGAGGKTLAMAAHMENRGRLFACDVAEDRLKRSGGRIRRAGADIIERQVLKPAPDPWVAENAGAFDRVLVDAPCSGLGALRRNPERKWRVTPAEVADLTQTQDGILDEAAGLVASGGRLIYATCAPLVEENERRIEAFLARNDRFRLRPIGEVWSDVVGPDGPTSAPALRLSPAGQGTDGFFCAVLERIG